MVGSSEQRSAVSSDHLGPPITRVSPEHRVGSQATCTASRPRAATAPRPGSTPCPASVPGPAQRVHRRVAEFTKRRRFHRTTSVDPERVAPCTTCSPPPAITPLLCALESRGCVSSKARA
eukprot:1599665-Rhodomonas_salina.1